MSSTSADASRAVHQNDVSFHSATLRNLNLARPNSSRWLIHAMRVPLPRRVVRLQSLLFPKSSRRTGLPMRHHYRRQALSNRSRLSLRDLSCPRPNPTLLHGSSAICFVSGSRLSSPITKSSHASDLIVNRRPPILAHPFSRLVTCL